MFPKTHSPLTAQPEDQWERNRQLADPTAKSVIQDESGS